MYMLCPEALTQLKTVKCFESIPITINKIYQKNVNRKNTIKKAMKCTEELVVLEMSSQLAFPDVFCFEAVMTGK